MWSFLGLPESWALLERKDIRVMGLVRERGGGGGVLEREDYRKEGFF